eukprot:PITA_17758
MRRPLLQLQSINQINSSSCMGWKIHQMDVKTAFLNGVIEEEAYIEQLEGFETFNKESHVCRLKRALYGLKQMPCAWYTRIDNYLTKLGFTKSEADANLYHIVVEGKLLIIVIVLYVDDLILIADEKLIKSCKENFAREFEVKDLGLRHYFLGMEVWQGDGKLFVSQGKYANEILKKFHIESSKPMETPLARNWRKEDATSDMCYAVNQLSEAMVKPTKLYWKAAKRVLRYLRGTTQFGLWYRRTQGVKLQGFTDVDWVSSPLHKKSTSGGIFYVGSAAISWYNRKQRFVTLRSAEAKYMVASTATCEAI